MSICGIPNRIKHQSLLLIAICILLFAVYVLMADLSNDENLPEPSLSSLSIQDAKQAVSHFESQHDSWLGVTSGVAKYTTSFTSITGGEYVIEPDLTYSGTLEFTVEPRANINDKNLSPVKVQAFLTNNEYDMNYIHTDIFDPRGKKSIWSDDKDLSLERMLELGKWTFRTELFFFPLDFMAKSYGESKWRNIHNTPKEDYFKFRGLPWRRTSAAEDILFDARPQYLFRLSPAMIDSNYWFSVDNGELTRVDIYLPNSKIKSFSYEDYLQLENQNIKFPQKFTMKKTVGAGKDMNGWEYKVYLTDLQLNEPISPEKFIP